MNELDGRLDIVDVDYRVWEDHGLGSKRSITVAVLHLDDPYASSQDRDCERDRLAAAVVRDKYRNQTVGPVDVEICDLHFRCTINDWPDEIREGYTLPAPPVPDAPVGAPIVDDNDVPF